MGLWVYESIRGIYRIGILSGLESPDYSLRVLGANTRFAPTMCCRKWSYLTAKCPVNLLIYDVEQDNLAARVYSRNETVRITGSYR